MIALLSGMHASNGTICMSGFPWLQGEQASPTTPGTAEGAASTDSTQEAPMDWQSEAAALEEAAAVRAKEVQPLSPSSELCLAAPA